MMNWPCASTAAIAWSMRGAIRRRCAWRSMKGIDGDRLILRAASVIGDFAQYFLEPPATAPPADPPTAAVIHEPTRIGKVPLHCCHAFEQVEQPPMATRSHQMSCTPPSRRDRKSTRLNSSH